MRSQRLCRADRQVTGCAQLAIGLHASADQTACIAVEAAGRDAGVALRRDHARVHDGTCCGQGLIPGRIQAACVVQASQCRVQVGAGKYVACVVIQRANVQGRIARHGLQLSLGIVDIATGQLQMTSCGRHAFGIVQAADCKLGILRRHDAAGAVQQRGRFDQRVAIAFDLAARVVQLARGRDRHQAGARLRQAATAVVQRTGIDGQLI
ncbi:hypothetical protein D3C81_615440 [compost metagenome]